MCKLIHFSEPAACVHVYTPCVARTSAPDHPVLTASKFTTHLPHAHHSTAHTVMPFPLSSLLSTTLSSLLSPPLPFPPSPPSLLSSLSSLSSSLIGLTEQAGARCHQEVGEEICCSQRVQTGLLPLERGEWQCVPHTSSVTTHHINTAQSNASLC